MIDAKQDICTGPADEGFTYEEMAVIWGALDREPKTMCYHIGNEVIKVGDLKEKVKRIGEQLPKRADANR